MTKKRNTILHNKTEELEILLGNLFTTPPAESPCHRLHAEDVEQRLSFLKNLLASESTSPSPDLRHVDRRLSELEAAFRAWDGIRLMKTTSFRSQHYLADGAVSTCSCAEHDDSVSEIMGLVEDDDDDEEESSVVDDSVEGEMAMTQEKRKGDVGGGRRRFLRCWVVVAFIFMGLAKLHFHYLFYQDHAREIFPAPT